MSANNILEKMSEILWYQVTGRKDVWHGFTRVEKFQVKDLMKQEKCTLQEAAKMLAEGQAGSPPDISITHSPQEEAAFLEKMKKEPVDWVGIEKEVQEDAEEKRKKASRPAPDKVDIEVARQLLADDIIESFADETGAAWAYFNDGKKKKFAEVETESFKDWLRVNVSELCQKPREAWVEPLSKLFASKARRHGRKSLFLRSAAQGSWTFDIGEGQALHIEGTKIQIIECPPMFRKFPHQLKIDVDLEATIQDIDLIDKYTHFASDQERRLFKACLCASKVPGISKPVQLFRGPPGATKTTACRLLKRILDPSSTMQEGLAFPKNERDWFVNCRNHEVLFFDNLNYLTKSQQDQCCRVVSGFNVEQRKLFTDKDVVSGTIKGQIVLNAIELTELNSDFLDRSILWNLERVPENLRKAEEDFWPEFEKDLPKIRGALFKILGQARLHIRDIEPPELRLKDFARYATACAVAMGWDAESFKIAVELKIAMQKDETIAQCEILGPLKDFIETQEHESWEGTATELLKALTQKEYGQIVGSGDSERIIVSNIPKSWPQNAASLGKELSRVGHVLAWIGIKISTGKAGKGIRRLIISKVKEAERLL